ncbi:MAG: LysM peptidoglycan-binding domain-containing protein [Chloroflexi bacterium]|nr:LysM peptidoglycan-binding domain-containing protein [Chloroflexota bacterium]MCL5074689.1 LysM peptidoglycan-binding domain-containing protein [Chloroflexota bacterium]
MPTDERQRGRLPATDWLLPAFILGLALSATLLLAHACSSLLMMTSSTVSPTPTATVIAQPTSMPTPTLLPSPAPTTTPEPTIYIIRPGDTLSAIAARYGVSIEDLVRMNDIIDPNAIIPGQKLLIPRRS